MLLDSLIEKRVLKVEDWMWEAFGGEQTHAGVKVSQDSALKYSAVFASVRVISETLASVPLKLYERGEGNEREVARDHPIYELLHTRPNPNMTSMQMIETLQGHVLTWGNAFAQLNREGSGRVTEIWPLRPDRCEVALAGATKQKVLIHQNKDGNQRMLYPGDYMHIAGLGFDGYVGYSVISYHRQAIALGLATEQFGSQFFGGGGKPPMVLKHPMHLSSDAQKRLRGSFERVHGSLDKSHRVMILDEGLDLQDIGIPNDDAQFLETRKFQAEEIARIFRVPPHKIGILDRATFSNIEHQSIEFQQDTVRPWAVRWEQNLNHELLEPAERKTFYSEFELGGLLRGDAKSRAEALAIQRQWGIVNANEWRALENMNNIPGDAGDAYLVPMNMVDASQSAAPPEEPQSPPDDESDDQAENDERGILRDVERAIQRQRAQRSAALRQRQARAYIDVFQRAADHWVNREVRFLLRSLKKISQEGGSLERFLRDLGTFYESFPEAIKRELLPVVLAFARLMSDSISEELGGLDDEQQQIEKMAQEYTDVFIKRHISSSQNQIEALIRDVEQDQLLGSLQERFEQWGETRAQKIATNESIRAAGALSRSAYVAAGVVSLMWAAVGENCPLCWEMDGRTVGAQERFLGKGDLVNPGVEGTETLTASGSVFHPPLHQGCDCMIVAAL